MLNSFCVTASCSSRASRDRSCITVSSRLRSYSRALVSAMAACAANRDRISWSRSVNPRFSAAAEVLLAAKMMPSTWSPSRTGTPRKCDIRGWAAGQPSNRGSWLMSASRSGWPSVSSTPSIPCRRGSGPMACHSASLIPSTTNSANELPSSGTPSAA